MRFIFCTLLLWFILFIVAWLQSMYPYYSGLPYCHYDNMTTLVPIKQPWMTRENTYRHFPSDFYTTPKQSTTQPCEYLIDALTLKRRNSIANSLMVRIFCIKPSLQGIYFPCSKDIWCRPFVVCLYVILPRNFALRHLLVNTTQEVRTFYSIMVSYAWCI